MSCLLSTIYVYVFKYKYAWMLLNTECVTCIYLCMIGAFGNQIYLYIHMCYLLLHVSVYTNGRTVGTYIFKYANAGSWALDGSCAASVVVRRNSLTDAYQTSLTRLLYIKINFSRTKANTNIIDVWYAIERSWRTTTINHNNSLCVCENVCSLCICLKVLVCLKI